MVGEASLGGKTGGCSSCGEFEADLTVLTEAVDDMESELEVMLILDGLMGDLLIPRSSLELLSLPFILAGTCFT